MARFTAALIPRIPPEIPKELLSRPPPYVASYEAPYTALRAPFNSFLESQVALAWTRCIIKPLSP